MKRWYLVGLGLFAAVVASCSDVGTSVTCGSGTVLQGNQCVARGGATNRAAPAAAGNASGGYSGRGSDHNDAGSAGENFAAGMAGEPDHGDGSAGDSGEGTGSAGSAGDGGGNGGNAGNNNAGHGGNAGGGSDQTDLLTSALDCGSRDVTGATVLTDPITQNATWSGVIHLPNGLSVRNEPTLTIAPGTKIIVGHNASVEFGYLGSHATIVAKGTLDKPIKFCGETDTAGYWSGLVFRSGLKSASVLQNVLIADGGATDAGLILEMPLLVRGVQVRNSGANGVNAAGFDPASAALLVTGATKFSLKATAPKGVEVPLGSQLTGNGTDVVDIGFASFDAALTFRDLGVPYQQLADVKAVAGSAPVVTFEPGVIYEIDARKVLDFGTATVHVLGSTAKPVVFQRLPCLPLNSPLCDTLTSQPTLDAGGRLVASGLDLRFENVELRRLGWVTSSSSESSNIVTGALTVSGAGTLKVDHVKFSGASGYGLKLTESAKFSADSHNLEVGLSRPYDGLWLACGALSSLPTTIKVTGGDTFIDCSSIGAPDTILAAGGSPYLVASLNISSGASLTLQPGVDLRLGTTLTIQSGGTLEAIGTSEAKIQFQPSSSTGKWAGIVASAGSTLELDYVQVTSAGAAPNGAAIVANVPILLAHSTISLSAGAGLKKLATDMTDYLTGNTFTSNAGANVVDLP